jgi:AraC-like DNA-binding protein
VADPHTYRSIHFGVETLSGDETHVPRHRHLGGYANVVLAGSFVESSFAGRMLVEAGDVLLHGRFDCHANLPRSRRVQVLRLPWEQDAVEGQFRVRDPDRLAILAARDPYEAMRVLAEELRPLLSREQHWTHTLASWLASGSTLSLHQCARKLGIRPYELSRGFRCEFGVSPKLFRLEARSRRAWAALFRSSRSLTQIAQDHGFSDLAHMSRSIRALTSHSPTEWRELTQHGALNG